MTTRERLPIRVPPSEWQHIVPIVTAQRRDSDASSQSATRAAGLVEPVSVYGGEVSVSRDSIDAQMDVYGYDGAHVGRVKEVGHSEFLVRRRWRADTSMPLNRVLAVIAGRVILTRGV
jgi:hypothetical protein